MHTRIIIVNYRTPEQTRDCLQSIADHVRADDDIRVTLVDNASGDGSAANLASFVRRKGWNSWIDLLPLPCNGGFAFGNNAAIRSALAESPPPSAFWLLNPDTVVRASALGELKRLLSENPEVGIVGSRLEDPDGTPQRSAFRFPSILSELDNGFRFGPLSRLLHRHVTAPPLSAERCATDWVAGASMLVRREVFEQIGLMDEEYFLYFEEVDFCRRASDAGWTCWYEPASRVVHLVGQSSGVTCQNLVRRRPGYWFDSRRRYFLKHFGRCYTLLTDAGWAGAFATWRCRAWLQGKPLRDPPKFLQDFVRNSAFVKGLS